MASRRRPPASRPSAPPAQEEVPQDAAERTVISQMPVFEDELPTPVPQVQAPPAPARPVRAPSTQKRAPAASRGQAPAPRGAVTRSRSGAGQPGLTVTPAQPRSRSKLGAAVPKVDVETGPNAPAIPREATFVGLPVGLGAPPPKPAVAPQPAVPQSAVPPRPAVTSGPKVPALKLERPASAPPDPAPQGLRLPKPGGATAPREPAASSDSGGLSQPAGLPLSAGNGGLPVPVLTPSAETGRAGRWMMPAAGVTVALILGVFVFSASEPKPADRPLQVVSVQRTTVVAPTANNLGRVTTQGQSQPSSAVQRAKRSKKKGASIARRKGGQPVWGKARLAALSQPGAEVPEFGGVIRKEINYHREYLEKDDGPGVPLLMIFTQPPGMTIEVSGKLYGRTPMLRPLYTPVSGLDIRLTGAGFKPQRQTVRAAKDGSIRLNVVMTSIAD